MTRATTSSPFRVRWGTYGDEREQGGGAQRDEAGVRNVTTLNGAVALFEKKKRDPRNEWVSLFVDKRKGAPGWAK